MLLLLKKAQPRCILHNESGHGLCSDPHNDHKESEIRARGFKLQRYDSCRVQIMKPPPQQVRIKRIRGGGPINDGKTCLGGSQPAVNPER